MSKTKPFKADGQSKLSTIEMTKRKDLLAKYLDEQIQFKNSKGVPLKNFKYGLCLEDGSWVKGTTDRFGKTQRVVTVAPIAIVKATLQAPPSSSCSCKGETERDWVAFALHGVKTNTVCVGSSVIVVETPKGESRSMTAGEKKMARMLFKDAVDYEKVRIHNDTFAPIQGSGMGMAPNGNIYFHPDDFREDFSTSKDASEYQFFMHEMTHVWQYQLGYPVIAKRIMNPFMGYKYVLIPGAKLCHFNMEQQGEILADYWAYLQFGPTPPLLTGKSTQGFKLYQEALATFIANPKDPANLPPQVFIEGRSKM